MADSKIIDLDQKEEALIAKIATLSQRLEGLKLIITDSTEEAEVALSASSRWVSD